MNPSIPLPQVYNESVRDLLNPESVGPLNVLENASGVVIPNLSMHKPKDESQLLQMLADGNSLRTQHPTDHNSESSRSHAVFQVSPNFDFPVICSGIFSMF